MVRRSRASALAEANDATARGAIVRRPEIWHDAMPSKRFSCFGWGHMSLTARPAVRMALLSAAAILLASPMVTGAQDRGRCASPLAGDSALRTRYAVPGSRWLMLDCEPIHYVAEGRGPTILLMHGSYASLRQWDEWADGLKDKYRVVRFDLPPAGLSGPNPDVAYSTERKVRIIAALLDHLKIGRALVVATSSGGLPASTFARERPGRVSGLILNNVAAGPLERDSAAIGDELKAALADDARHPDFHSPALWRAVLRANFRDPRRVTEKLVREWTDLNNRALKMPGAVSEARKARLERTAADLPQIRAPTLLLWSANDHEVPLETHGRRALELSGGEDKQLLAIPDCGHLMPLECPVHALALAMPFIRRHAR